MQFKNPEILYFLALLIIPVLIHLFQLQKFVKVPFTNVAFLKKIVQETRKSSRLKKWLILATRLLLFTAILFAFSQPYLSNKNSNNSQHTFLYLDNSLSTNAKGEKGNLLQVTAQEIIEHAAQSDLYSLQTNSDFYKDITYQELKNKLLNINYSTKKMNIDDVFLKIKAENKKQTNTSYKNILISDFQNTYKTQFTNVTPPFSGIQVAAIEKDNLAIDSVFIDKTNNENLIINVVVKNQGELKNNIPIAISNNNKLISKQTFSIDKNANKTIAFNIQNQKLLLGKIDLTFSDTFLFDNTFYFSLNTRSKINVLSIGNESEYLSKIYTKDEFNYTTFSLQNINYNALSKQQLIILNELEKIPEILAKSIIDFSKKGGAIVIIPNSKIELLSYNSFLKKLTNTSIKNKISDSLKITNINFNHPLFKNVFSKKVRNFQYPIVESYYPISNQKSSTIIGFENNLPFVSELNNNTKNVFWFSSSVSKTNSNFTNSPLIVPVFYNFGKLAFQHSKLYYYLDEENNIDIDINLGKDEILTIKNSNTSFIPPQQTYQNKVTLTTYRNPLEAGFYNITNKKDTIQTIAYNTPKEESLLNFLAINSIDKSNTGIEFSSSIANVFKDLNKKNEVQWLWKWFLALAIVSLLLEILILKFYKP